MQFQQTITLHPANTVTAADALARYTANVQTWLGFSLETAELSMRETIVIREAWRSGRRTDTCAGLIHAAREQAREMAG